jgi:CubicO group peptidase (beta-lactamase class C family)
VAGKSFAPFSIFSRREGLARDSRTNSLSKGVDMSHVSTLVRASCAAWVTLFAGCGGGDDKGPLPDRPPGAAAMVTVTPADTGDGWQISTPAAENMDPAQVLGVLEAIRDGSLGGIDSLVIARNGRLVAEGYFNGFARETPHDLRSTGKSFTSALAGIAVTQNLIQPDDLISRHIPNFDGYDRMDARKRAITVRHLLNMMNGLDCDDWNSASPGHEEKMYDTRDWVKFVLDLPAIAQPGTQASYCTAGVVLLGHLITQASGVSLDSYAATWLFGPLDIREVTWRRDPDGRATGGGGLRLRPRDAAKLGVLYAGEGLWNGIRVLPESWVMQSRQRVTSLGRDGYGFLWWKRTFSHNGADLECFFTSGNGGNYVFVFPALELVATFTASNYNSDKSDYPFHFVPAILAAAR